MDRHSSLDSSSAFHYVRRIAMFSNALPRTCHKPWHTWAREKGSCSAGRRWQPGSGAWTGLFSKYFCRTTSAGKRRSAHHKHAVEAGPVHLELKTGHIAGGMGGHPAAKSSTSSSSSNDPEDKFRATLLRNRKRRAIFRIRRSRQRRRGARCTPRI